jgi:class 3 adenylate cyclase/tetratricopeptide (TPR) repeat protein
MAGESRKTVTVVFTDVTGSTSLGEQLDPEALRGVMARYFETAQTVLERHGGTVEKFIGDAVMAVFGIPTMHEDDAVRAVRAAAELRDELETLNVELERERGVRIALRTGVNTGEVVVGDPSAQHFYATGDAVNVAARLEQAAAPGEILLGDSTRQLVRDAVELEPVDDLDLKGKTDRVPAWRLARVDPEAAGFARRLESPLVGRREELERLVEVYEQARDGRRPRLCTILAAPGVGKSRLSAELAIRVDGEATVLVGRCLSYGEGITYWPLVEIVQQIEERFRLRDMLAERPRRLIETLTGSGQAGGSTEEAFWAVRKLLEALARERPLIIVLDDVHWAEATFLDLVEHVLEFAEETPLLVVALARPEFLDERPLWASHRGDLTLIRLEPLSDEQTEVLIDALAADARLPEEVRRRIGAASAGNPLFLEQMLAMLSGNGQGDGDVAVPPTIQALLAARIDELAPDERAVAEPAAVVGQEFWREAVVELCPPDTPVSASLQRLVRKELIGRARSGLAEEDAFRFRHILIRDAAYAGIAKGRRAELHERFAGWLERTMPEYEEIVGYHLEQSFRYREELGPLGESERQLGRRAGERLGSAGLRASDRGDVIAAVSLLDRAVALLPSVDPRRFDLLCALGSALEHGGRLEEAEVLLAGAAREAANAGDRRAEMRLRIELALVLVAHADVATPDELEPLVDEAVSVFDEFGDDVGLAATWTLSAFESWVALSWQEMSEKMERALAHARRAGNRAAINRCFEWLTPSYIFGPTPVAEAIARIEEIRAESEPGSLGEAGTLTGLGWLEAMRGDVEKGRALHRQGIERLIELGALIRRAGRSMVGAEIELLAGDPAAAEAELREGFRLLDEMGEKALLSTVAFNLGEALYLQGRYEKADELTRVSEDLAPPDDIASQVGWRALRAKILARRGELEQAERLSTEALRLIEQTDALSHHADVLVSRAEVLRAAGHTEEAKGALEDGIRLYETKGIVPAVERTRALLSELTG